jgi:hypothetical protein
MLRDRLLGALCLGAATLAATWGGNDVLHEAAHAARAATPPLHADAVAPAVTSPDTGPAPAADPSSTATTAAAAPSTTTATTPGAPTTTAPPGEAPAALAQRALVTQADVPAGFRMSSPAPPDGAAQTDSPFERCAGSAAGSLTSTIGARARSATFANVDTGSVSSLSVVFDQPATAEKVLGLMTTPGARACFEDLINARLARNPKLSQDVKGSLGPAPSPAVGDGALAYRFDVRLPAEDVDANAKPDDPPVRFVADFVLIRKGRTLLLAEFDNLRQPWVDTAMKAVAANIVAHA